MGLFSKRQPQTKINDLIFKELIKRGYSLEGNTRIWNIADSKLWYLTPEQAQSFLNLELSPDYQKDVIKKEIDLININIEEMIKKVGNTPLNIVDLGCGDGKKAELFINHLKGKVKLRYCPVDISSYMVEKAMERLSKTNAGEVVKFQYNISDFENVENITSLLRQGEYKKNLILLLGNTLGNFEINELLYEVRSSMKENDFLLIGNGLNNKNVDEILRSYNNKDVNNFLKRILLQIGLEEKEIKLGVRFRNSRVEVYYTILTDKRILFQDKSIGFSEGDQIVVAYSYKYDRHDFMGFLKMYFNDVRFYLSEDQTYALALCQK